MLSEFFHFFIYLFSSWSSVHSRDDLHWRLYRSVCKVGILFSIAFICVWDSIPPITSCNYCGELLLRFQVFGNIDAILHRQNLFVNTKPVYTALQHMFHSHDSENTCWVVNKGMFHLLSMMIEICVVLYISHLR